MNNHLAALQDLAEVPTGAAPAGGRSPGDCQLRLRALLDEHRSGVEDGDFRAHLVCVTVSAASWYLEPSSKAFFVRCIGFFCAFGQWRL